MIGNGFADQKRHRLTVDRMGALKVPYPVGTLISEESRLLDILVLHECVNLPLVLLSNECFASNLEVASVPRSAVLHHIPLPLLSISSEFSLTISGLKMGIYLVKFSFPTTHPCVEMASN